MIVTTKIFIEDKKAREQLVMYWLFGIKIFAIIYIIKYKKLYKKMYLCCVFRLFFHNLLFFSVSHYFFFFLLDVTCLPVSPPPSLFLFFPSLFSFHCLRLPLTFFLSFPLFFLLLPLQRFLTFIFRNFNISQSFSPHLFFPSHSFFLSFFFFPSSFPVDLASSQ